jgi:glucan biosynthesis protein C
VNERAEVSLRRGEGSLRRGEGLALAQVATLPDRPLATLPDRGPATRAPGRRGELDVLRALVVVGLVFFHSAVIFGGGEFPLKADREYRLATVLLAFGATWGMPLLFVISGMGVWHSLGSRGPAGFARERLRRLGMPLLTGLLTLVPLQVWLGLRHAGDPAADGRFYLRFWDVRPALDFPFVLRAAPDGLFQAGHLWFLVCLLGFTLALLPVFVLLRPRAGRLAGVLARPGGVLLLALPPAAVEVLAGSEVGHAAWNDASYALFLLYGFLAAADPRVGEAFRRRWRPAMALAVLLFLAGGAAYAAASGHGDPFTAMDPRSLVFRLVKAVDGWLWVVAILGLAGSRPARPAGAPAPRGAAARRLGAYANEAVLPFYVLHETVVVAVAAAVLAWSLPAGAQYLLIAVASLAATLVLYELGVRHSRATRLLFGLKPAARDGSTAGR